MQQINHNSRTRKRSAAPFAAGMGERSAIRGYKAQYDAAAYFSARALRERLLQEVRLADLEAGRVDDLVLVLASGEVHGYQMKAVEGELSFNDFTRADGLLFQLAQGWKALREKYPKHSAHVHLISDQILSNSTHANVILPLGTPQPTEPHFLAFWQTVWLPYQQSVREGTPNTVGADWQPAWETWQRASGLSAEDFLLFAVSMTRQPFPSSKALEQALSSAQVEKLTYLFQAKVADARSAREPVTISPDELTTQLGVQFHLRNEQAFQVSTSYQPIVATVDTLLAALTNFHRGYVAVVGTPGSGKSSLLTRTLVESGRRERIVRYYCFVLGEEYVAAPRGEAENFLNDLVTQLERDYDIQAGERLPQIDLSTLRDRFREQLRQLGEDYARYGLRTILLVDGLDHVSLDSTDYRYHPLLSELPQPQQLPEGVLIVLGTQHLRGLHSSITAHLSQEPARQIEMQRLDRNAVLQLIQSSDVWSALMQPQYAHDTRSPERRIGQIDALSEGHPLALQYIVNQIQEALAQGLDIDQCLLSIFPYDGNIYSQYQQHWNQVEEVERGQMRELVGLLARIRGALDFAWIRTWEERLVALSFETQFRHFLRRSRGNTWMFFHDSFRQFLLQRSLETPLDGPQPEEDWRFHARLARLCDAAPEKSRLHWNVLYHHAMAREYAIVCDLATPERFEAQIESLRPLDDIISDARLATRAAARLHDPVRLWRCLLLWTECEQREGVVEAVENDILTLLVKIEKSAEAVAWVLRGEQLRSERFSDREERREQALLISGQLAYSGYYQEASEVFAIAEPLALLRRGVPFSPDHDRQISEVLQTWANVAPLFRTTDSIIQHIRALEWTADSVDQSDLTAEQLTRLQQNYLLRRVAATLLAAERWNDFDRILLAFVQENLSDQRGRLRLLLDACQSALDAEATEDQERYVERLESEFPVSTLRERVETLRLEYASLKETSEREGEGEARWQYFPRLRTLEAELVGWQRARIAYALLLYRGLQDEANARELIEGIPWFALPESGQVESVPTREEEAMWLCSLVTAVSGKRPALSTIVPDSRYEFEEARIPLARTVYRLAILRGERWREQSFDPFAFRQDVLAILRFHHQSAKGVNNWRWNQARQQLPDLCAWLLDEADWRGEEAVRIVWEELQSAWRGDESLRYWSDTVRRRILLLWLARPNYQLQVREELNQLLARPMPEGDVTELVKEACKRAQDASALGEREQCQQWIVRALHSGLGIGQEKDYQVTVWMRWAVRHNGIEPVETSERIERNLHRAIKLADVGGGRQAILPIVEDAFRWSPARAVVLFWWLFEANVLDYEDTLRAWLTLYAEQAAVNSSILLTPAFSVLHALALPLLGYQAGTLPIRALLQVQGTRSVEELRKQASATWEVAMTEGEKRNRAHIAAEIEAALKPHGLNGADVGISPADIQSPPETSSYTRSNILRLRSGEQLTWEQVCARIQSDARELVQLRTEEVDEAPQLLGFDWKRMVERIAPNLPNREAIQLLAQVVESASNPSQTLVLLGERALSLGARDMAEELGQRALAASRENGWHDYFDGGSRRAAYTLLVELNPVQYRPLAFDAFANDLSFNSGKMLALGFDDLLPVLGADNQLGELCTLVEDFVQRLFAAHPIERSRIACLFDTPQIADDPAHALAYLLVTHVPHPTSLLSARALRQVENLWREQPALLTPLLKVSLQREDEPLLRERLLMICDALPQQDIALLRPLIPELHRCTQSTDFSLTHLAQILLVRLGEDFAPPSPILRPPQLSLLMPPPRERASDQNVQRPSLLVSLSMFNSALRYLERVTDVEEDELIQRALGLMAQRGLTQEKFERRENWLRSRLQPIYLPYTRPHVQAVRRVVTTLIRELQAEGRLPKASVPTLYELLRAHDPALLAWRPERRPSDIVPLESAATRSFFVANIEEDFPKNVSVWDAEGRYILAEWTTLSRGSREGWERREISTLFLPSAEFVDDLDGLPNLFQTFPGCTVARYSSLRQAFDELPALCMHTSLHWFDTLGSDWIALSPLVARLVGWTPASQAFCWNDEEGQRQVTSYGWQDGTTDATRVEPDGGWRVTLTAEAWQKTKLVLGEGLAVRIMKVSRGEERNNPVSERFWVLEAEGTDT